MGSPIPKRGNERKRDDGDDDHDKQHGQWPRKEDRRRSAADLERDAEVLLRDPPEDEGDDRVLVFDHVVAQKAREDDRERVDPVVPHREATEGRQDDHDRDDIVSVDFRQIARLRDDQQAEHEDDERANKRLRNTL